MYKQRKFQPMDTLDLWSLVHYEHLLLLIITYYEEVCLLMVIGLPVSCFGAVGNSPGEETSERKGGHKEQPLANQTKYCQTRNR